MLLAILRGLYRASSRNCCFENVGKAVALTLALGNQVGNTYSIEEVQQCVGYSTIGGLAANAAFDKTAPPPPPPDASSPVEPELFAEGKRWLRSLT